MHFHLLSTAKLFSPMTMGVNKKVKKTSKSLERFVCNLKVAAAADTQQQFLNNFYPVQILKIQ